MRIRHGLHGLTRLFYVIIALKPWNPCNPCLNIFFSDSFWIDFRHKNKRTYFLHSFYSKFVLWGLCLKKESLVHISTVWSSNRVSGLPPFTFSFPPPKKGKNRRVLITSDSSYHWRNIRIESSLISSYYTGLRYYWRDSLLFFLLNYNKYILISR